MRKRKRLYRNPPEQSSKLKYEGVFWFWFFFFFLKNVYMFRDISCFRLKCLSCLHKHRSATQGPSSNCLISLPVYSFGGSRINIWRGAHWNNRPPDPLWSHCHVILWHIHLAFIYGRFDWNEVWHVLDPIKKRTLWSWRRGFTGYLSSVPDVPALSNVVATQLPPGPDSKWHWLTSYLTGIL